MKYVLVIAGSDSSGGAGMQGDVRTVSALGAHALTALTALTAQNSSGVHAVHEVPAPFITMQIDAVLADVAPDAVKVGMLYSEAAVREAAEAIERYRLTAVVVDPVLTASAGGELLHPRGIALLRERLLPLAAIVTPNLPEAEALTGRPVKTLEDMEGAARAIKALGPDVVITGGHLKGDCVDLFYDGSNLHRLPTARIKSSHTHGTGCVYSSALAVFLAGGKGLPEAARLAQDFTRCALAKGYACGKGAGAAAPDLGWKESSA